MNTEKKALKAEKRQEKVRRKQDKLRKASRFKQWRKRRPFWGASLTLLAGLLILWIPLNLYMLAFAPGNFAIVGLLFGGLITIIGVMAYIYPQFSTVLGVMTIFLSVISIMGALGGFVVGTILGIVGGSLCIAWRREVIPAREKADGRRNVKEFRKPKTKKSGKPGEEDALSPTASSRVMFVNENNEIASTLESDKPKIKDGKPTVDKTGSPQKVQTQKAVSPADVLEAAGSTRIHHNEKKDVNEKRNA
ncbi:MAG TPA: DUF6114 domain-containing protein [Bacillales bacterium]|nr:DUF6114 domain-containing protein [Bacillales bacterium]